MWRWLACQGNTNIPIHRMALWLLTNSLTQHWAQIGCSSTVRVESPLPHSLTRNLPLSGCVSTSWPQSTMCRQLDQGGGGQYSWRRIPECHSYFHQPASSPAAKTLTSLGLNCFIFKMREILVPPSYSWRESWMRFHIHMMLTLVCGRSQLFSRYQPTLLQTSLGF